MGSVAKAVNKVRLLCRDRQGGTFSDSDILLMMEAVCSEVHRHLSNIQSVLCLSTYDIDLTGGVELYNAPQGISVVADIESVFIKGENDASMSLLAQIDARERKVLDDRHGRPDRFYLIQFAGRDKFGFYPIPDATYHVTAYYMGAAPELFLDGDLPWMGIWNDYITLATAMRLKETVEGDIGYLSFLAAGAYADAMNATYRKGTRRLTSSPRTLWFAPEGT